MKKEQMGLKKLTLNRETIAKLSDAELAKMRGVGMPTGETDGGYGGCSYGGC